MLASKFHEIGKYTSHEEKGYRLLPFQFIALDVQRYVLTNLIGEMAVIPRSILNDFVTHKISPSSSVYLELKSKHFLIDEDSTASLDLLALKCRTKLTPQSNFTALHIFVVTLRCDYSCPYCQVSRQTEDREAFDMSVETALASLDMVFKSPSPVIKIEFQGGESLLNFDLIKKIVLEAEERNKIELRNLEFVIATNLSLLNDDILNFCLNHEIYLSTSLDGPASLHNKNRPRPGKNGYELTVDGIKRAQNVLGPNYISALMTTTESCLGRYKEIIDEYISLGFHSIFLRPLSPYGFAVKTHQMEKYDTEQWIEFYKKGLDYILEVNRKGYPMSEQYASIILQKMLTPFSPGYVDLQSPAGAGIAAVVYNYDGDVYASDESRMLAEMGDKKFRLGNVLTDRYEEIFMSDSLLDLLEETVIESVPNCSDCGFKPYCGSDPIYHYATQKDVIGNKSSSGFCTKNMAIFRHLITLLEDDAEARKILLSWAFRE